MKKSVFSVDVNDERCKKKAMNAVSGFEGIVELSIDSEKKTLTVIGDVDPTKVVCKLRKKFHASIETVGPNKDKGKDDKGQPQEPEQMIRAFHDAYNPYYWHPYPYPYPYPHWVPVEDNPSTCVIC